MKRYAMTGLTLVVAGFGASAAVWITHAETARAHCEVPCGIYDDPARVARLHEDATTIAKAIAQIQALSGKHDALSVNQMTRWITTKEAHASHIIELVSQYFLTQRVKPIAPGADGYDAYLKKLADHHAVMVAAMKTKQTPEPAVADALHQAIDALAKHYK